MATELLIILFALGVVIALGKRRWDQTNTIAKKTAEIVSKSLMFVLADTYTKDNMLVVKLRHKIPSQKDKYELSITLEFSADHPDWETIKHLSKCDLIGFGLLDEPLENMASNQVSAYLRIREVTFL